MLNAVRTTPPISVGVYCIDPIRRHLRNQVNQVNVSFVRLGVGLGHGHENTV